MKEKNEARQTVTGIIRSRMAIYQARKLAGELQKTFAAELTAEGYPISHTNFRKLYWRAKRQLEATKEIKREESTETKITAEEKPVGIQPEQNKSSAEDNATSHRPADIDAIIHESPNLSALAKFAKRNRR